MLISKSILAKFAALASAFMLIGGPVYYFWIGRVFMKGFLFKPFLIFSAAVLLALSTADSIFFRSYGNQRIFRAAAIGYFASWAGSVGTGLFHPAGPGMSLTFFSMPFGFSAWIFVLFFFPIAMLIVPLSIAISLSGKALESWFLKRFGLLE